MRFIFILLFICCVSCKGNRHNGGKNTIEENINLEQEDVGGFSHSDFSEATRYNEVRRIDPNKPPEKIDIIGNRINPSGKVKLSRFFDKIEYIKIKQTTDTINGKLVISPDCFYIMDNTKGLAQFNKQGVFVRYICKNYFPHTVNNGMKMVSKEQGKAFYGATDAYWNEGRLYYKYEDRPEGKVYMIAFDENSQDVQSSGSEQNNDKLRLGTVISELSKNSRNSMFVGDGIWIFAQGGKGYQTTEFITIMSVKGDTLCSFKDFDPVKDYNKSLMRGFDSGDSYLLNGIYNIRQSYNDTVYEFTPPNVLTSKYILYFGDMGIKSSNEGVDVGIGLENKLVGPKLLESDKHLFITYTKDYSCPNTAISGSLKYSQLIYDKISKNMTILYIDKAPDYKGTGWPEAPRSDVENDLDGMPFVWPVDLTSEGKPFAFIQVKDFPEGKRKPEFFKNAGENDYVVIIYN